MIFASASTGLNQYEWLLQRSKLSDVLRSNAGKPRVILVIEQLYGAVQYNPTILWK